LFVLGHTKRDTLEFPAHWPELKMMKHGDTVMRFLEKGGIPASAEPASPMPPP
jgi:hypothetical protein